MQQVVSICIIAITLADCTQNLNVSTVGKSSATVPIQDDPSVCVRHDYGRGVGTVLKVKCHSGEDQWGGLCYPKCRTGYSSVLCCLCRKSDCEGMSTSSDGASCIKPKPYGRGVGYPWKFGDGFNDRGMFRRCERAHGRGNCEKYGLIVYPKCRSGFHAVGCCICSPTCPSGYKDIGSFCIKPVYGRGPGVSRLGCPSGKENNGGLCYYPCKSGYRGVGPVCWQNCPSSKRLNCGLFCTSNKKCAVTSTAMVGAVDDLGLTIVSGGIDIATGTGTGAEVVRETTISSAVLDTGVGSYCV